MVCALFDLAPSLSQVGWISNPLLVELLAVKLFYLYTLQSQFYKNNKLKRGLASFNCMNKKKHNHRKIIKIGIME